MQVSESSTQGASNPPQYDQTGVDISDDEEDSNIDPQLLATAEDAFSTFLNSDDQAETAEDDDDGNDDTATTMAMTEALTPLSSPFPTETFAWIEALAKLNVVRRSRGLPSDQVVSPAKDSPSLFIYRCRNASFGCSYTTSTKSHHLQHQSGCTPERLERLSNITGRQELVCPRDGCGRTFMWKDSLNEHLRGHDYVPSRCPNPDCEETTVFTNLTAFDEHRRTHDGAQKIDAPRVCPLHDQCGNDQTWQRKSDLKGHLQHTKVHSLNKEAIDLLLGDTDVHDLTHKMQKAGEQVKEAAKKIYQAALMLEASNAGIKPAKRQRTME
ncbi:Zinc finger protein 76 [Lasiodiplodia hormozganensis]|uniref:Zinc finger protein 76 n=1 Tax=Lasiodiplodia hormozganensis TaxID=869390 RepID=A0AA40CW33_9PEZI|nr:Zinc finger protein 76 [Lasiodiplodia hormozganensis]